MDRPKERWARYERVRSAAGPFTLPPGCGEKQAISIAMAERPEKYAAVIARGL